jgi:aryl-alcohol dehydrogenase-like predicted oxidoreductase
LAGAGQAALAWVLSRPQVTSAIIGATRLEQLEENVKAFEVKLSAAEWKEAEAMVAGQKAGARRRSAVARSQGKARAPKRGRATRG